jgi:hypothetical protein
VAVEICLPICLHSTVVCMLVEPWQESAWLQWRPSKRQLLGCIYLRVCPGHSRRCITIMQYLV